MERIEKQPALLKRFEQLLNIVENSTGDIQKANEAEMRVIKELREMGHGETVLNDSVQILAYHFSRIISHSQVIKYSSYIASEFFDC